MEYHFLRKKEKKEKKSNASFQIAISNSTSATLSSSLNKPTNSLHTTLASYRSIRVSLKINIPLTSSIYLTVQLLTNYLADRYHRNKLI